MKKQKSIQQFNSMKFNKWLENQEIKLIESNEIVLQEFIHKHAKPITNQIKIEQLEKYAGQDAITRTIVVKQLTEGGYALITGYKWLMIAKFLDKPIQCVVLSNKWNRSGFLKNIGWIKNNDYKAPVGTELIYPIHKVSVIKKLQNSNPSLEKYNHYEELYRKNGMIDKPITVVQNYYDRNAVMVVDGYIRYLILKNDGVKHIPIKFLDVKSLRKDEKQNEMKVEVM